MTAAQTIGTRLQENFDGRPWHGTPLRRMLDDVNDKQAHARPIPNARTIAELLAHITAWIEIVQRRLTGEEVNVTPELDFPDATNEPWSELVTRLDASFDRLQQTVRSMDDGAFDESVRGKSYSRRYMLHGLMQHNTYHAAQIAMLKKFP